MAYRILTLLFLALLFAPIAHAEPVTTFIVASAAAVAEFVAANWVAVSFAAASAAIGLAAFMMMPGIDQQGSKVPPVGTEVYEHVVGRMLVPGNANRRHSSGDDNKWFFECRTLCANRIQAVLEIRLNDYALTFGNGMTNSSDGFQATDTNESVLNEAGVPRSIANNAAYFEVNLGNVSEPVGPMLRQWGNADSNARHQPHATLSFRLNKDPFELRMPQVLALIDGEYIYDPRDADQNVDDPSTWGTTDSAGANPALVAAWYVMQPWSFNTDPSRIDWDLVIEAANVCDETVPAAGGGTEARYRMNARIKENENRESVIAGIVESMAGHFVEPVAFGKWRFFAGAYRTPVMDIINDDISSADYSPYASDSRSRATLVRGKYLNRDASYSDDAYPSIYIYPMLRQLYKAFDDWWTANPSATDAERRTQAEAYRQIEKKIDFPYVHSVGQAQRIAHIVGMQAYYQKRWEGTLGPIGQIVPIGDNVTLTDDRWSISELPARVVRVSNQDQDIKAVFVEQSAEIYTAPELLSAETVQLPILPRPAGTGVGGAPGSGNVTATEAV